MSNVARLSDGTGRGIPHFETAVAVKLAPRLARGSPTRRCCVSDAGHAHVRWNFPWEHWKQLSNRVPCRRSPGRPDRSHPATCQGDL